MDDIGLKELVRNTEEQREIKHRLDRIADIAEMILDRIQTLWVTIVIITVVNFVFLLYLIKS